MNTSRHLHFRTYFDVPEFKVNDTYGGGGGKSQFSV